MCVVLGEVSYSVDKVNAWLPGFGVAQELVALFSAGSKLLGPIFNSCTSLISDAPRCTRCIYLYGHSFKRLIPRKLAAAVELSSGPSW